MLLRHTAQLVITVAVVTLLAAPAQAQRSRDSDGDSRRRDSDSDSRRRDNDGDSRRRDSSGDYGSSGNGGSYGSFGGGGWGPWSQGPVETKPKPKPFVVPRVVVNIKLPDRYRSFDKDNDGQIGVYEWPRNDIKNFLKLDQNSDGFLTPEELIRGGGSTSVARTGSGSSTGSGGTSGDAPAAGTSSSMPVAASDDPVDMAFGRLDKDKNGTVTQDEWSMSFLDRATFEKANIAVRLPMNRSEFAIYHSQLPAK